MPETHTPSAAPQNPLSLIIDGVLENADLSGALLEHTDFSTIRFLQVSFRNADLRDAA